MEARKWKKLEEAGWNVGDTQEFLDLSDEELAYIEVKLTLSRGIRRRRTAQGMTQGKLAAQIGSSQSRVAKMEAGDPSVSVDLLVKTLIALGVSRTELAELIGSENLAVV